LSYANPGEKNPAWEAIDYIPEIAISTKDYSNVPTSTTSLEQKLLPATEENKDTILRSMVNYEYVQNALLSIHNEEEDTLQVDIVIIGSGCGGGIVAHQLVSAGYQVLVVEKNGYYRAKDFQAWRESEAMANCYDKAGLLTSSDGNVLILAGSCVGGGSTINWSASFAPPPTVLHEWATIHGLEDNFDLQQGAFHFSFSAIQELLHINTKFSYYGSDQEHQKEANEDEEQENTSFAMNENNRALWKVMKLIISHHISI